MAELRKYRVKAGKRFGAGGKHGPGEVVLLEPSLAGRFMDKLEAVEEEASVHAAATTAANSLLEIEERPYRVRVGQRHGAGGRYGPGEVVYLSPAQAARFRDKLEPVAPVAAAGSTGSDMGAALLSSDEPADDAAEMPAEMPQDHAAEMPADDAALADNAALDVANARMDVVMEWVTGGQLSVADALSAERASRRPRSTLVRALEALI